MLKQSGIDRKGIARQKYFGSFIFMQGVRNFITGKNEKKLLHALNLLGFKEHIDFFTQYPIGNRWIIDFAFVNEKVAIELDGDSHKNAKQKDKDKKRDSYLRTIGWVPLRINEKKFLESQSMFMHIIQEVIKDRRDDWQNGKIYQTEDENYDERNFQ